MICDICVNEYIKYAGKTCLAISLVSFQVLCGRIDFSVHGYLNRVDGHTC
jgi:hypothetical protein